MESINPESLGAPSGYSNGVLVDGGRLLFIAGQVAWDREHQLVGRGDFVAQFERALGNVLEVVWKAGGKPEHVVELTIFVVDKKPYVDRLRDVGQTYRKLMGKHFPAMALVVVKDLLEDGALVEIRGIAAIP
ncbi:MAG: RidA family protein [Planctomycetes bacterium]|nr:RidA family protein [Planctomycetota bacterium]